MQIKEYAEKAVLLNLRGEPRSTTTTVAPAPAAKAVNSATMTKKPAGATVVKPDASADKDEEAAASPATTAKPAAAKKKPAAAAKPAAAKSEPAEEKREPRPPKVNIHCSSFFTPMLFLLFVVCCANAFFSSSL